MTIFRLKQLASSSIHAAAGAVRWNFDRSELIADAVVHIIGVCFGLVAATALIVLTAVYASAISVAGPSSMRSSSEMPPGTSLRTGVTLARR